MSNVMAICGLALTPGGDCWEHAEMLAESLALGANRIQHDRCRRKALRHREIAQFRLCFERRSLTV